MPERSFAAGDLAHVLAHTEDFWRDWRGERLFVTGGTGFFGRWLLETLTDASDRLQLKLRVVVLTRSPERFKERLPHLAGHPAVDLCPGDMGDFAFPEGRFSAVLHVATETVHDPGRQDP